MALLPGQSFLFLRFLAHFLFHLKSRYLIKPDQSRTTRGYWPKPAYPMEIQPASLIVFCVGRHKSQSVLFLTGIYACRRKKQLSWLVVFPLGMLVWANSHGSFLIGLALLGIWTLDEIKNGLKISKKEKIAQAIKPLIYPTVALGVSILAITANPSGLGILNYALGMMKNSVIQTLVPEWAPPSIYTFEGAIFWGAFTICLG